MVLLAVNVAQMITRNTIRPPLLPFVYHLLMQLEYRLRLRPLHSQNH